MKYVAVAIAALVEYFLKTFVCRGVAGVGPLSGQLCLELPQYLCDAVQIAAEYAAHELLDPHSKEAYAVKLFG